MGHDEVIIYELVEFLMVSWSKQIVYMSEILSLSSEAEKKIVYLTYLNL